LHQRGIVMIARKTIDRRGNFTQGAAQELVSALPAVVRQIARDHYRIGRPMIPSG